MAKGPEGVIILVLAAQTALASWRLPACLLACCLTPRSASGYGMSVLPPAPISGGVLATLAAVALTLLSGCEAPHLAGTNDAALEYEVRPDPATGTTVDAELAAAGIKARISSALAPSDVDATATGTIRVVVDADTAGAVDDLLAWRGGIRVSRSDDGVVLAPPDTTGIRPMSALGRSGEAEERWWQGTGEAVARAVRTTKVDAGPVLFAERLPDGEYRTRVAVSPPVVTLGVGGTPIYNIAPIERGAPWPSPFRPSRRPCFRRSGRATPAAASYSRGDRRSSRP